MARFEHIYPGHGCLGFRIHTHVENIQSGLTLARTIMIVNKDVDLHRNVDYRYMVRTKARSRRPFIALSDPCSSGSNPDISRNPDSGVSDLIWGRMVKTSLTSNHVITRLEVWDPPTGSVLSTPDGFGSIQSITS